MWHNAHMTPKSVTDLRSAAFELLEAAAHREPAIGGSVSEVVDRLQLVANELGAVERLLGAEPPLPGELRRRRYAARAYSSHPRGLQAS